MSSAKRPMPSDDDENDLMHLFFSRRPRMEPAHILMSPEYSYSSIRWQPTTSVGEDEGSGTDYEYLFGLSDTSEYDIRSSSSTSHYMDSNLSDSSVSLDYEAEEITSICDKIISSDDGYIPDDSDVQITNVTTPKTYLSLPARFKTCVRCRKENNNSFFQYCFLCFKFRTEYFENKPTLKRKRIRHTKEENVFKDSQESSLGSSSELSSQKEKFISKSIEATKAEIDGNSSNLCNICLSKPKNGVINHGKIGHVYSCYPCAKLLWKKFNKCPLCNVKIKFVTKIMNG